MKLLVTLDIGNLSLLFVRKYTFKWLGRFPKISKKQTSPFLLHQQCLMFFHHCLLWPKVANNWVKWLSSTDLRQRKKRTTTLRSTKIKMEFLPVELLVDIFGFLSFSDLQTCCQVSHFKFFLLHNLKFLFNYLWDLV